LNSTAQNLPPRTAQSIAAVERDTGIHKDTLRVWERRYGFPQPERNERDERVYPPEQVDKLRIVRRLLDAGHRPGKVMPLSLPELNALARPSSDAGLASPQHGLVDTLYHLVLSHDTPALRQELAQASRQLGLAQFVMGVVVPLNERIGNAWIRGELQIFEEHLYTEVLQSSLRSEIVALANAHSNTAAQPMPRVLLATVPGEEHGIGLLMAEALFTLEGCQCVSLGVQTPLDDIALAVRSQRADVLALSFSASMAGQDVIAALCELRQLLAAQTHMWVGGSAPVLTRPLPAALQAGTTSGVTIVRRFDQVPDALAQWQQSFEHIA
jgi:MerR family transcriptional regulator, light-induced transcriptional regulator